MEPTRNLTLFLHQSGSIYHIITNLQGRYSYVNELYRKIFYSGDTPISQHHFQDSIVPEDLDLFENAREECISRPGTRVCIDLRRSRSDGSFFWVRWEFSAIVENEQVTGLQALGTDASERKRAEQEKLEVQEKKRKAEESLRVSIERYNIMSKATNDAIWDWDLRSNNVHWNDAIMTLFGYRHEHTIGNSEFWEQHIHPDDRQRVVNKIERHISKGIENWQDEYRFQCMDSSYKYVFDRGYILFDGEEKPYRMIGAMMDITERKKLQDELASATIARQRQVTEATILAQEKERAEIGRELHDNINQILTTTKMYLDIAITEEEIREELMVKSHENISSAIEEIRILSKSLVPPSLGDIGLKEAISEMINNLRISQKMDIRLRTNGLAKVAIPDNIELMVFRIVQEQMNNILKHAHATEAEIKLNINKNELSVVISDNGAGFDTRKRGKGIGLTNITSRAELHQGNVEIISSPGNGCTLKIAIPI